MRLRFASLTVLAVALLAASPPPALTAQLTPTAADATGARTEFEAGERAFREDDYALALTHFRRAMQLAPRDAVRFNLAVCLERLGRFREAQREYDAAAHSPQLDDAARARAKEQASRTRERLGTVSFEGPSDATATVTLGDETLCAVPCSALVDPTTHDFEIHSGERTLHAHVTVGRGEVKVVRMGFRETPLADATIAQNRGLTGPLSWVGGAVALAGTATFIILGLRASQLHEQYLAGPTASIRDQGIAARDWANVGLGVGIAGVLALVGDLVWHAARPAPAAPPPVPVFDLL